MLCVWADFDNSMTRIIGCSIDKMKVKNTLSEVLSLQANHMTGDTSLYLAVELVRRYTRNLKIIFL